MPPEAVDDPGAVPGAGGERGGRGVGEVAAEPGAEVAVLPGAAPGWCRGGAPTAAAVSIPTVASAAARNPAAATPELIRTTAAVLPPDRRAAEPTVIYVQ